jgi:MtrB/PioB family decaheme-associated outer membrane protein
MRIRPWAVVVMSFAGPGALLAQDAANAQISPAAATVGVPDLGSSNFIDFGLRGTVFADDSDQARFQRYRDLRNGPTVDLFRLSRATDTRAVTVQADHLGYRDQRYSASYNNYGKLKASFEWNQIPLFYSQDTATLYASGSPGVLRIDDVVQASLENRTATLAEAVGGAQPFDLRHSRDVLNLNLTYSATDVLDWTVLFRSTSKTGNQPWAGPFGFSNAVELAVPIDTRTTELGTALEWANRHGMARLGYDGSFFRNSISTLTWDNPLRLTDSATAGSSQGRMALWPDSNMNAANATAMLNLPWRSRATAYLSVGSWTQNDQLIPFTVNSALPIIPVERATAEAEARVTAMTYSFTSKPSRPLWFSARYRSYDFDNRTPLLNVPSTVAYDASIGSFAGASTSPHSFTRRTFDADASLTPTRHAAFGIGYTREQVDQTFRSFDTTSEDAVRISADATGLNWLIVRAVYEHRKRVGSGFDEQALDDIGEQISLRQFDIADRNSDRFSGIVQITVVSALSFNAMASVGREDRSPSGFGLRSNNNHAYSAGADYVPGDTVSLGIAYTYEQYDALQASRQANPGVQFDDPTRDWTTDSADRAHTVTASMDVLKLWAKTDVRVAYDFSHAMSQYVYGLAPNSTLAPVVQLPKVINAFQRATADVRYYLTRHLAASGSLWFDRYRVDDFALDSKTLATLAQPSFVVLGSLYRPYTASTITGRLTYLW